MNIESIPALNTIAAQLGNHLIRTKQTVCTAESCTGGWVAQAITAIPGSSQWFERGFIPYSNTAKQEMLGVSDHILQQYGAVSESTAIAMASGALQHSHADISVAITGIAGPGGGTQDKPVGLVWFAWGSKTQSVKTQCVTLQGDRTAIRIQAVTIALRGCYSS